MGTEPTEPTGPETAPTPPPAETAPTETTPPEDPTTPKDWEAETAKWKALARKNEDRAKANADAASELEKLRKERLSDQEKAIEEARAEGERLGAAKLLPIQFAAEVGRQAAARLVDPDYLEDPLLAQGILKLSKIPVLDDGEIDADAVKKALDSLLERKPHLAKPTVTGGADQGATGGNSGDTQDLGEMSMEEFRAHRRPKS